MDSGLGTGWGRRVRGTREALEKGWRGVLGQGIGYLGAPGRVVRISPRVRVKGPASCHFCPTGQPGRLGGADVRPGEGAFIPGGLLGSPRALPGRLGPLLWPHPPPVTTAAASLAATGAPALAARLLWGPSGRAGRLCGHPVFLAGSGRWRRAVSPQGVGARHRHVLELVEQQREGPILGAFAAPHDGLGSRAMAGRGPGKEEEDTGRGSDTQGRHNITHTQRQDRDGMKKCHGVMMGPGGWGRPLQSLPHH